MRGLPCSVTLRWECMEALVVKELEAEEAARAKIALRPRSCHSGAAGGR